jgi:hypothetical protein
MYQSSIARICTRELIIWELVLPKQSLPSFTIFSTISLGLTPYSVISRRISTALMTCCLRCLARLSSFMGEWIRWSVRGAAFMSSRSFQKIFKQGSCYCVQITKQLRSNECRWGNDHMVSGYFSPRFSSTEPDQSL